MGIQQRRERERADRHQLIIRAARELAEAEGWDAVTTRRLSERIEYSQPVLYSHFDGKDAIVAAVAVEGFAELAATMRRRTAGANSAEDAFLAMAESYVEFAEAKPAVYDAMFTLASPLPFGADDVPAPLREAYEALLAAVAPLAGGRDPGLLTEVTWSALHGLITLTRAGRLQPGDEDARFRLLVAQLRDE